MNHAKTLITELARQAGISIDGPNPWDPQVREDGFYPRLLKARTLGLGESYMEGWWDCERLDEFFTRLFKARLDEKVKFSLGLMLKLLPSIVFNLQRKSRAFIVGEQHYDIGNDLYQHMLDERLTYTCGYWKSTKELNEAQEHKLDLVCRKLDFQAGQRVLDIGCGWGSFAKFAAERYGVSVVGITVSKRQVALGRTLCEGFPIELRLQDYRDVDEKFDHVVSLGMFEHVGYKNYHTFMDVVQRALHDDGLCLLHTIGSNVATTGTDPWIDKYIFPNSTIPSIRQIGAAIEGLFVMEDWHNFSVDYDKTLMAWHANFERAWPQLKTKYDERFYRMWRYFLLSSAALFRSRKSQLWQIVLSKRGVLGGYRSMRA